ncbi:outer membrane protein assembly factor BamB [methanotrophic endosymbiont of Bathymodiolus puteoserpentis (Logatchev)]|jgi:outer membrane protein assembly factor BamB|uniref:outer membrane protein assembly factor BamB n=1 Tax=methanotrophic endosymbiont of Bathymodiolus puteoserpentis (Logatchev) TaxID=343235 RepID=UPI00157A6C48|nr:outer membrane protein assembly factor BamB [methanotrophic endosymbiont of Bathymodiolus puteoserpentis (Logatchev)]
MRKFFIGFVLLALSGCTAITTFSSAVGDLFSDADNAEPPAELTEYQPEIKLEILWDKDDGVGTDGLAMNLVPAIADGHIIIADHDGLIQARSLLDGELLWEVETELPISSGPVIDDDLVFVGTSKADVLALNVVTGEAVWKHRVSSEIMALPVVAGDKLLVRTTDGKDIALNRIDGKQVWSVESSVPALSIRGAGSPVVVDDSVIIGNANGKLIALNLMDGAHLWETSIAIPKGRSEIERLTDINGTPVLKDYTVFVSSYKSGISAVSPVDGEVLWRNESISATHGLNADQRYLYLSDVNSDVWQLDQRNGASYWKQTDLHQRRLSVPAVYDDYVVVGDFEGYLHWLSKTDGRLLARIEITDSPIVATPIVVDDVIYVYASDGTLAAVKVVLF